MSIRIFAAALFFASSVYAQPACTPERIKEIQVELDGITAIRQMGGLNAARGACTVILSIERFTVTWGGSVIDAIEAQLKRIGVTVPANAVSTLCKNIHHFADDFVVGKREKELRDELALCSKKE